MSADKSSAFHDLLSLFPISPYLSDFVDLMGNGFHGPCPIESNVCVSASSLLISLEPSCNTTSCICRWPLLSASDTTCGWTLLLAARCTIPHLQEHRRLLKLMQRSPRGWRRSRRSQSLDACGRPIIRRRVPEDPDCASPPVGKGSCSSGSSAGSINRY